MPETRGNPIWQLVMKDYKEAVGRATSERQKNEKMFSDARARMQDRAG